jgi:hypothetical protein
MASSVLTGGKNSATLQTLVYDTADRAGRERGAGVGRDSAARSRSSRRRGRVTPSTSLQKAIVRELARLRPRASDAREVQRAINQMEASFYRAWSASAASAARPIS